MSRWRRAGGVSPIPDITLTTTVLGNVGQASACGGLQPARIENAGPGVLVRRSGEPGSDRVLQNAVFYALELLLATHQLIVALAPPEWLSRQAKQMIGFSSRSALQSPQYNRGFDMGREQQVYMVGHHHPGVQEVIPAGAPADRSNDHFVQLQEFADRPGRRTLHPVADPCRRMRYPTVEERRTSGWAGGCCCKLTIRGSPTTWR